MRVLSVFGVNWYHGVFCSRGQSQSVHRIQHVCNIDFDKPCNSGLFKIPKRSQRDKQLSANRNIYQSPRMLAFMGLLLYISVHWNARMTEMEQSEIEVLLAFADNGQKIII